MNRERFTKAFNKGRAIELVTGNEVTNDDDAALDKVQRMQARMVEACDASMPRRKAGTKRRSCYWWSDEVAQLRAECIRKRRTMKRVNKAKNGPREGTKAVEEVREG